MEVYTTPSLSLNKPSIKLNYCSQSIFIHFRIEVFLQLCCSLELAEIQFGTQLYTKGTLENQRVMKPKGRERPLHPPIHALQT